MPAATDIAMANALRLSVMRLARRLRAQRPETSLTLSQLAALATLDRHGPLTPGELAAHEKISPPSMTRILAVLESRDLVTRTPHPTDGRQVLVAAGRAGLDLLREDRRRRDAWLAQRMQSLSDDELAVLRQAGTILDKLADS